MTDVRKESIQSNQLLLDQQSGNDVYHAHHIHHELKGTNGAVLAFEHVVGVAVGSLHPNQPGVWQVVVVDDTDVVDTLSEDDVLSRQCHHPGVLQVSVRV